MISASIASAQKTNTPEAVKVAFSKLYPAVKEVKWDKEKSNYEAGFTENGQVRSVLFDASGAVLETEIQIAEEALPAAARKYLAEHYKGSRIREAARITDRKGKISYEAEVNGKDILFDAEGQLIR